MSLWLLRYAAWRLGLKVGLQAMDKNTWPNRPVLIILASNDQRTLDAMSLLADIYRRDKPKADDARKHQEWAH